MFLKPTSTKPKSASLLDALVDVLFVASVSHVGARVFDTKSVAAYATFAAHWLPLFLTYGHLESFCQRFGTSKGLAVLYFGVCFTFMGAAVNFSRCQLPTSSSLILQCGSFAFFVGIGRFVVACAWVVAVLSTHRSRPDGQSFLLWKVLSCLLPGTLYLVCMFLNSNMMAWEVLWFVAVGLDLVLVFVPSSFFWFDQHWPRQAHYTEERYGMLHVVSLAEVAVALMLPRDYDEIFDVFVDRYTDVALVLGLVFVLALWSFVVCETSRTLLLGKGIHALQSGSWWRKSVWMICQFVGLTGVLVMGLIARSISVDMTVFDRLSFGIWTSLAILCTVVSQAVLQSPSEVEVTLANKWVLLGIRTVSALVVFALSFVSLTAQGDTAWLGVIVAVTSLACMVEYILR